MKRVVLNLSLTAVAIAATGFLFAAEEPQQTLTDEQMERFLQTAKVIRTKSLGTGITNSRRATLTDGVLEHDAHVQTIDESKAIFQGDRGTEMNFKDSWKFNIAAYRLDRILHLNMTPVAVERKFEGKSAAFTWWVNDTMMEIDRQKKHLKAPDPDLWNSEMYVVRVFDQLIFNTDRNLQNLLIDKDWHIWMIDHTRSFRMQSDLRTKKDLEQCDRALLARLRELTADDLKPLNEYVAKAEIKGLLARRDKIVAYFDQLVKTKGEGAVLYDRHQR